MTLRYSPLPHRGVLHIAGPDRHDFLQGLVSNDVTKATADQAVHAAFLTPQGKFLCDFFILASDEDGLLLDVGADALPAFKKKLMMFKLRADVKITDVSADYDVYALFGGECPIGAGLYADPRLAAAGYRAFVAKGQKPDQGEEASQADYDRHRIALGLPDGLRDMTAEKSILLENGFDELHGVDWDKGCYMGQELTARTKYRALIKKRLFPIEFDGNDLAADSEVMAGDKAVGTVYSSAAPYALALLRLNALEEDAALSVNGQAIKVHQPDWMVLPKAKN